MTRPGSRTERLAPLTPSSRSLIRLVFPEVGVLRTNKDGRVQFVFDPDLVQFVEAKHAVPRPPSAKRAAEVLARAAVPSGQEDGADPIRVRTGAARRQHLLRVLTCRCLPLQGIQKLRAVCLAADRVGSTCVARLQLEEWLHKHCGPALALVDGRTVISLMAANVFGKSGKFISWKAFVDQLERAVVEAAKAGGISRPAAAAAEPARRHEWRQAQHAEQEEEEQQNLMAAAAAGPEEEEEDYGAAAGAQLDLEEAEAPLFDEPPAAQLAFAPAGPTASLIYHSTQQAHARPTTSRAEVDAFNRQHFDRLYAARGWSGRRKRELTPKVSIPAQPNTQKRQHHPRPCCRLT